MQLESVCSLPVEELLLTRLAFTPEGHHVVAGHKDLTLYEVLSGKAVRVFPFEAFAGTLAFSSDGRYLACVNDDDRHPRSTGLARVFDVDTGKTVSETRPALPVETGCFLDSPQGTVFLYRDAAIERADAGHIRRNRIASVRLLSGEAGESLDLPGWEVRRMAGGSSLTLLGLDAPGQTFDLEGASLNVHQFKLGIYPYPDGKPVCVRNLGTGAGVCAFSPDGAFLALETVDYQANRHDLALVDVVRGARTTLLALAPDVIPVLAFSEDGSLLACLTEESESPSSTLRLWNTATRELTGQTTFGSEYHAIALHWATRRIAGLGGGKCDICLIHR